MAVISNRGDARRSVLRGHLYDTLGRFTSIVAVEHDGVRFLLPTADRKVGRLGFISGGYETEVMEAALTLVSELSVGKIGLRDRIFIDVGANIGTTSIPAVVAFAAKEVIAFEPEPMNCRLLRANIIMNGLEDKIRVVCAAVSDRAGTASLELSSNNWGDHRVRNPVYSGVDLFGEDCRPQIEIQLVTLDSAIREIGIPPNAIGLIWIDTQGHEAQVLAGAGRLLAAGVPVVAEYWPYGLERAGGLQAFHDIVARTFNRVVDVRASAHSGQVVEYPAASVADLQLSYRGTTYTDLLLLHH